MADPFLGEIRAVSFTYAPRYWATCDGQQIPLQQSTALYALLGNMYGGSAQYFNLPNLSNKTPMGAGAGPGLTARNIADTGGSQTVTLTVSQMGQHAHTFSGTAISGNLQPPANNALAPPSGDASMYTSPGASPTQMANSSIGAAGGGLAHNNMQPYLGLYFIIALQGIFPQRP